MTSHMTKAIEVADRITTMAEGALAGLERQMAGWPAEYRAIVWGAVADIASRRASKLSSTGLNGADK